MSDNDLIRRGDAFAVVKGLRLLEGDITALPAVNAQEAAVRRAVDYCDCHDFRDGGLELAVSEILASLKS